MNLSIGKKIDENLSRIYFLNDLKELDALNLTDLEKKYIQKKQGEGSHLVWFNHLESFSFYVLPFGEKEIFNESLQLEKYRRYASELYPVLIKEKIATLQVLNNNLSGELILAFAEALSYMSYQFNKYKSDKEGFQVDKLLFFTEQISKEQIESLKNLIKATDFAKDLINEPVLFLTAEQLSKEIEIQSEKAGYKVKVLEKKKIESLKMNGLLAVNKGSMDPPTFTVMEYKPKNAVNEKPYILVGKGVVFDTGGLSLKPTLNSMDRMKYDMSGAAAVAGTMWAVAKNKLPIYVVGLIPATDNRPGMNAITPGDIIEYTNGNTVEILNTDAEGRLILADALCYASQNYDPLLVIDLATLTGSAAAATGAQAAIMFAKTDANTRDALLKAGELSYERLLEFPLWDEYNDMILSDIADIKNIGGSEAGAITAAKFLEHFVTFPWIHLDIAGVAFAHSNQFYKTKGPMAYGVRLLYQFLKNQVTV